MRDLYLQEIVTLKDGGQAAMVRDPDRHTPLPEQRAEDK